jgi:hypothetical protein
VQASLVAAPSANLQRALRRHTNNGKYGASKFGFPTTKKPKKFCDLGTNPQIVCQTRPRPKKFKEYRFEVHENTSLLVAPIYHGETLYLNAMLY